MMRDKTLYILIGLPGSGKSTFAKKHNAFSKLFSSDAYRKFILGNEEDQSNNGAVFSALYKDMRKSAETWVPIIFDATNLTRRDREKAIKIGKDYDYRIVAIVFDEPISTCIERQELRERKVPTNVILGMIQKYQVPTLDEGFDCIVDSKSFDTLFGEL